MENVVTAEGQEGGWNLSDFSPRPQLPSSLISPLSLSVSSEQCRLLQSPGAAALHIRIMEKHFILFICSI